MNGLLMHCRPGTRLRRRAGREAGAVLLEVVLALTLFVFAAAVIAGGLNAAAERVERLRRDAQANDLAATVMAELLLGLRPLSTSGEEPCAPPFEAWTAQVETSIYAFGGEEATGVLQAQISIRHPGSGLVHRLTQLVPATPWRTGGNGIGESAGTAAWEDSDMSFETGRWP